MSDPVKWQKMLQERRVEHKLEIQTRQIESVLTKNELPGEVSGGYIRPGSIRFDLVAHMENGFAKLKHIKNDLFQVLGASYGELIGNGSHFQLHVDDPNAPPVSLLDVLPLLPDLPELSLILGMSDLGQPILVNLADEACGNVLISGDEDAGKSSLIRSIALSLALTHKQSHLQLAVLDGSTSGKYESYTMLEPLSYLPHMLAPVAYDSDEYQALIEFLGQETAYRQEQRLAAPGIVVLIDELLKVLETIDDDLVYEFMHLVQRGPEVGIYHVVTNSSSELASMSSNLKFNLPVHLIGKTQTSSGYQKEQGIEDSSPQYLLGKGDFLALINEQATYFQAAYIDDYDLHLTIDTLQRNRPQPLLAQPLSQNKPVPGFEAEVTQADQPFIVSPTGVTVTTKVN